MDIAPSPDQQAKPAAAFVPQVGVIGAGGFGRHHLCALQNLSAAGLCRVAAACDVRPDWTAALKADPELSVIRPFHDEQAMLESVSLDYVVVSSPPHLHFRHAAAALGQGSFVYLEKPPVPTIDQLRRLMRQPGAERVAVGFQLLEAPALLQFKRRLVNGDWGKLRGIRASALWPRESFYYERAPWAGRLKLGNEAIFDGPLTNALSHLVHSVFYLAGSEEPVFAAPASIRGCLLRARPIESYDFGWIQGTTTEGVSLDIMAGHCGCPAVPWKITVETDRGSFGIHESDLPPVSRDLLMESHRGALRALAGKGRIRTRLGDCLSYSAAVSAGYLSSGGVRDIPSDQIELRGDGPQSCFHVQALADLVGQAQQAGRIPDRLPSWLELGPAQNSDGAVLAFEDQLLAGAVRAG